MVDTMTRLISATMLLLATTGCQRRSNDGLSYSGKIATVTEWPSAALRAESVTDSLALYDALQKINNSAPPVDYENQSSPKLRQDYIDRETKKILQGQEVLLVLKCTPSEDLSGLLSFSTEDRNLRIQLYSITESMKHDAQTLRELLQKTLFSQFDFDRSAVLGGPIDSELSPLHGFEDRNKPLMVRLGDAAREGSIIQTASGVQINIDNNPLQFSAIQLSTDLIVAEQQTAQFEFALLEGKRPDIGASERAIQRIINKLNWYPDQLVPDKLWRAQIPFSGDPKNICLIGRFSSVGIFNSKGTKGLRAQQTGWFIIDRTSMNVIASRRIPTMW